MLASTLIVSLLALLVCTSTTQVTDAAMYWGVASSGFQYEGSFPDSNWMRYVKKGKNIENEYKNSVDFYHRYTSDIALAKAMGVNTYRFSVEWARIEPQEGVINQTELAFYDGLFNAVVAAGMTPMVTLDHWVYPGWIADQGAWDKHSTVEKWLVQARRIVTRYARRGALWITINEPTEYISRENKYREMNVLQQALMTAYLVETHRRAYDMIHQLDPGALVSSNFPYQPPPIEPFADAQFFDHVKDKLDFIAMDYYYGLSLDNWSVANALNGNIWDIKSQPDGLYYAIMSYHKKIPSLPFYIVENGMPTDNGVRTDGYTRSNHLLDHIYWLQRAVADGVTVIGYNYWGLTDNYEWGTYRSRFGLYKVDVLDDPTLTRNPTDAVATYKQIIANNGVPAGYTPVMPPSLCVFGAGISACVGQIKSLLNPPTKSPTTRAPTATKSPTQWWQKFLPSEEEEPTAQEQIPASTIGGIIAGSLAGVGLIAVGAVLLIRQRRRRSSAAAANNTRNSMVVAAPVESENPMFSNVTV